MNMDDKWSIDKEKALGHKYRPYFKKLEDSKWQKLSYEERCEVLQKVEEYEALTHNRPVASFQTRDSMPLQSRGYYSPKSNTITQNYQYTMSNSSEMALQNVLHEGRHGYQWDCIKNPQKHPEISESQRKEWEQNLNNYISAQSAEDKMQYFMQPVEVDARTYAQSEAKQYEQFRQQHKRTDGLDQHSTSVDLSTKSKIEKRSRTQ